MDNVTKEERNAMENSQNNQSKPTTTSPKKTAKKWYLIFAALLLIVALIIALMVMNANNQKDARQSLEVAVASVNSRTPAVGITTVLDSVTYDVKANRVAYYNNILRLSSDIQQMERAFYRNLSDQDLKVILLLDFEHDYLSDLILQNEASVRYVYGDTNGAVIREIELTKDDLSRELTEEEVKQASMTIFAHNAKSTQLNCPQQIDRYMAITGCQFDSAKVTITFEITLSSEMDENDKVDFDKRRIEQKESITHLLSHDPMYLSTGAVVVYKYLDKNGNEIMHETISPKDYKDYHHEHEHEHEHEHTHHHD